MSFTTDKPNKKSCKHKKTWELSRTPSLSFLYIYGVCVEAGWAIGSLRAGSVTGDVLEEVAGEVSRWKICEAV